MATYKQLRDRVLVNLTDAKADVQAAIGQIVNGVIRDLQAATDFECMRDQVTGVLTANSHTAVTLGTALPIKRLAVGAQIAITLDGGTSWEPAKPIEYLPNRNEATRLFKDVVTSTADTGSPQFLTVSDQTSTTLDLSASPSSAAVSAVSGTLLIEAWPAADRNNYYRVTVPFYGFLPDLSADGDTNWFTLNAERYIEYKASAEGFFKDWDEQRASVYEQRAAVELRRVMKLNGARLLGKNRALAVRADVFGSRTQQRRT